MTERCTEGAHPISFSSKFLSRSLDFAGDAGYSVPHLGVVAIPHRDVEAEYVSLAVGAGAPDEAMSTLGINV